MIHDASQRHIEIVSNGLGGQSMYLLWLAGQGRIPATYSITADTGSELDRVWSTGERTTAREYFDQVVAPLGKKWGIDCRFVRAVDKAKNERAPIHVHQDPANWKDGKKHFNIPLYGSNGGQLRQTCTEKWKIRAIHQEAKRIGAKTMRTAQGIHIGEAIRRVKGRYIGNEGGWSIYRTTVTVKKVVKEIKWLTHYYPLVDLKLNRDQVRAELLRLGIPFLESSECDCCPHKDLPRWLRTSPEKLAEIADIERRFNGEFFFTVERVPILQAIEIMKQKQARGELQMTMDFGCGNAECGI